MKTTDYRPAYIEFLVASDGSPVPEHLGTFDDADAALVFMNNFFSTNQGITVARHMDNFEKSELRKAYNDIMENLLPKHEQDMRNAVEAYNHAKTAKDNAVQLVQAYINEARATAEEVKRGVVEMELDELFTWKLPYKGRYYFYTFIDNSIRLVRTADMTPHEKTELFSQGKINEDIFDKPTEPESLNGTTEPQPPRKKGRPKGDKKG